MLFDSGVVSMFILSFFLFFLGAFVFLKNTKSPVNRSFFIFNLFVLLWMIAAYLQDWFFDWGWRVFFAKADFALAFFLVSSFLYFCMALVGLRVTRKNVVWWMLATVPFAISILAFATNLIVGEFTHDPTGTVLPILGPLGLAYYAIIALALFSGLALLGRYYRSATSQDRSQYLYLFLGIILTASALSYVNIFLPDDTSNFLFIYRLGIFSSVFLVIFPGYSILRFRLLSGKMLAVEMFSLIILLLSFMQVLTAGSLLQLVIGIVYFFSVSVIIGFLVKLTNKENDRKEELQRISDSLAKANERLKELDNTKTEFISIASHQLRTPLTAIKGYLSLVLEGSYGTVSVEVTDVLEKLNLVNRNLIQLVEDLLNVSRIDAGRIRYSYEPTDVVSLVREQTEMFMPIARDKEVSLTLNLTETEIPEIMLDPGKIRESVSNLIDNALKYTEKGSVTVSVEPVKENMVRIVIADTGIGFQPGDGEKLFGKFMRTKETTKVYVGGTGLGLYVGKSFVEAHGGRMWAESDGVGTGARFIIELPYRNPQALANEGGIERRGL